MTDGQFHQLPQGWDGVGIPCDPLRSASIRPKTLSASRHSLAFSQALSTLPQVTSVAIFAAFVLVPWVVDFAMEKVSSNHSKQGNIWGFEDLFQVDFAMNWELTI